MTWVKEKTFYPPKKRHSSGHIDKLCVSADGGLLIGGGDKNVFVWDISSGEMIASSSFRFSILDLAISSNGKFAMIATGNIYYWDLTDPCNEPVEFMGGMAGGAVDISQNSMYVAIYRYRDTGVIVWDLARNAQVSEFRIKRAFSYSGVFLSPDLRYVATSDTRDKSIHVWEIEGKNKSARLKGHSDTPNQLHFLDNGKTLVSFARDGEIIFWDLSKKKIVKKYSAQNCFTIVNNGELIAEGGEWYVTIRDSEWATLKEIRLNGFARELLFSPSGRSLYAAIGGGGITKWIQKEPMEKAVQGILQLTNWTDQAILYFKQFGYFAQYSQLNDEEYVSKIKEAIGSGYLYAEGGEPTHFDLVRLLTQDTRRVWWGDAEVVDYDTVYTDIVTQWSDISRGAFAPSEIKERWSDDNQSVMLSFMHGGDIYSIAPKVNLDWLDLSVLNKINNIISPSGYCFYVFDEPYDQTVIIICLTAEEKDQLEADLGISFQHLRAS